MKTSEAGKIFIKEKEGLRLEAYRCSAGALTIGYGHTGSDIVPEMRITPEQAEVYFFKDLENKAERYVNRYVKVKLTQGQFDALVSFTFNLGAGNLLKSTLLKLLNAGDYAGAAEQFERWTKSGGKVTSGLVKRRREEKEMFLMPEKVLR